MPNLRVIALLAVILLLPPGARAAPADDETVAVVGGTVLTVTRGTVTDGVILIRDGLIAAVGPGAAVEVPEGATVIDARGRFVMPGIIDAHSHIALAWGDINEATSPSTPQVRMADAVVPDDYAIYCALAGGVTAAKLMHGSANVIGGLNVTVKLKYGRPLEEMLIPGVRQQLKMALGENPKWVYGGRDLMPSTRPGVFAVLRQKLEDARHYAQQWERYRLRAEEGEDPEPPRRDLELEMLADLLRGEISIDCHCYVAHEIVTLLQIANEYDLPLLCLSHALEAYKVADEIAALRPGISILTHTDWWGYKWEAFDAIPYQPGMLLRAGINTCIVSDSGDVIRRLYGEAAKVVGYCGVSENEALAMITINPARALEIDHLCGSLEVGKHADLAIFDRHPLDSFTRCVMTLIEGRVEFDIENPIIPLER